MTAKGTGYWGAENHEREKARVASLFHRWIKRLGLGWWQIDIDYADGVIGRHADADDCWATVMVCDAQWQYLQATISVALMQCEGVPDETLEKYVLHELMHIFVAEMREKDDAERKHEERVVSTLANAFLWLRDFALEGVLEEQREQRIGISDGNLIIPEAASG